MTTPEDRARSAEADLAVCETEADLPYTTARQTAALRDLARTALPAWIRRAEAERERAETLSARLTAAEAVAEAAGKAIQSRISLGEAAQAWSREGTLGRWAELQRAQDALEEAENAERAAVRAYQEGRP